MSYKPEYLTMLSEIGLYARLSGDAFIVYPKENLTDKLASKIAQFKTEILSELHILREINQRATQLISKRGYVVIYSLILAEQIIIISNPDNVPSIKLNLPAELKNCVAYTLEECLLLGKCKPEILRASHLVKKKFNGEFVLLSEADHKMWEQVQSTQGQAQEAKQEQLELCA